jgi:hypothetical protein
MLSGGNGTVMGVTVQIGDAQRSLDSATADWIHDQLDRRNRDQAPICIIVSIAEGGLNLRLSTPSCSGLQGGGRPPNQEEQKIFDLWNERKLNSNDFSAGEVVAFLKQLGRLI